MKVLIVEDDRNLREALVDTLSIEGVDCLEAASAEEAISRLSQVQFVITDVNMPGLDGHELLAYIRKHRPDLPVVLATAYGSVTKAVQAMQQGALDYLVKPFNAEQLINIIKKSQGEILSGDEPIAESASSQHCLMMARKVAQTDSTILSSGESGTGKEVLARYIHQYSDRKKHPFIAINCAAIPENMLEATLFGHEKGAFTGAHQSVPGKFEQANGGTILLDEISEMDLALQAKLLRVLQEREVERIGGRKTIKLDVRVLATTNRDLKEYVAEHHFREDLYYRLNVFPLHWLPLRQRVEDIVPIAERILNQACQKMNKSNIKLSHDAKQLLQQYAWPGNIRELDNAIQRALILQCGNVIISSDLGLSHDQQINYLPAKSIQPAVHDVVAEMEVDEKLTDGLKHKEFELILDAIKHESGSKGKAAASWGISSRTLRYKLAKMREIGIDVDAQISAI